MSKQNSKTLPAAKFKIGDKVRVKHGFRDVDYPDMRLGGWAGTVTEAYDADNFTIRKLLGDDSKVTEDGLFLASGSRDTDEVNAVDVSDIKFLSDTLL